MPETSGRYLLLRCPKCRNLLTADSRYGSRACPRCKKRIELSKTVPLCSSNDARRVAVALQERSLKDADERG